MSIFFQAVPCYAKGAAPKQAVLWGEWAAVAVAGLNDAVLSQLVQLQVAEGFPRADHGDIWGEKRLRQHKTHPGSSGCPRRAPCCPNRFGIGTPYLFPALPCPGCHRQTCKESETQSPPDPCHAGTPLSMSPHGVLLLGPTHPCTPFLGGLLLNCLVCLCLNLGGPFRGVAGPPVTLVADLISGLWGSRLMAVPGPAACPGSRLSLRLRCWHGTAPQTCWRGDLGHGGLQLQPPHPAQPARGHTVPLGCSHPALSPPWLSLISFLCSPWGRAPSVPLLSPQPGISPAQSPLIPLPQRQRRARRAPELVGQCLGSLPPTPGWMWHPGTPRWHHPGGCARR